jgi:hypothetical protein
VNDNELRPYLEAVNFEQRLDDAEALRLYIASHITCRLNHHRERSKQSEPCATCGSTVSFDVTSFPEAS